MVVIPTFWLCMVLNAGIIGRLTAERMHSSNPSRQILTSSGKSNPMWIPPAKIRNSNKITANRNRKFDSFVLSKTMGSICNHLQMLPIRIPKPISF